MSGTISGIDLKIKSLRETYGIKQSSWNTVYSSARFVSYPNERELIQDLRHFTVEAYMCDSYGTKTNFFGFDKTVKTGEYLTSNWNFPNIGYFHVDKGFFSDSAHINCANCGKGQVRGNFITETAKIKVVKESATPSKPSWGSVINEYYVLWSIQIDMKCDTCDRHILWDGINNGSSSWGVGQSAHLFSKI